MKIFIQIQSVDNCLGHIDSKDYNYPICLEELVGTKCIDVGCGENFTVVIASEKQNKLAYYNLKEFYAGILDNAKDKVKKIKDFYSRKIKKTMSSNDPLDKNALLQLNLMGTMVGTPSAFNRGDSPQAQFNQQTQPTPTPAANQLQLTQTQSFNIPKSEQSKNLKPASHIILKASEDKRKADFESFHINKQIRQAEAKIRMTKGEFNGYKQSKSSSSNKLKRQLTQRKSTTNLQDLQKEIVLDEVTQRLQFDEDEFLFHDENKRHEEKKNQKNDPREFLEKKPKGVLVSSIFKEQIDLIYKEYSVNEKKENLQEKYLKNVRSKDDDFFKSRMKTDSSIRQKFQESRKDMSISNFFATEGGEQDDFAGENQSQTNSNYNQSRYYLNQLSNSIQTKQHSRPQTASSHQALQKNINSRSIQNSKLFFQHGTDRGLQLPPGDFLKKQKFVFNQKQVDAKKERTIANSVLRDFRTELAKKKLEETEEEKKQYRDQKRIEIYMKSREYLDRVQQEKQYQQNTDSIRNNWAVYLNAEMICAAFKKLAELGLQNIRKEFEVKVRLRKMQFHMRDFLMRKKIKKLSPKQIFIMRQMIGAWVKRKLIQKQKLASRLIVLHCVQEKIKKKLRVKISIKRNQIIYMQNFIRWARKSLHQQRKILCQIWDAHILHIFRQQIIGRNLDGKQLDFYRTKFQTMLISYTAVKQPQQQGPNLSVLNHSITKENLGQLSIPAQQNNNDLNASNMIGSQYLKTPNLQTLNVQDFQTVNGQLEDFDSYLKGKSTKVVSRKTLKNALEMSNTQQIGFTLKESNEESIHEIIKRKAQQNTMFGGLLEQLKFKGKAKEQQVMDFEEEELQNLDSKMDSKNDSKIETPLKSRNVLFKDLNSSQNSLSDDKARGPKSILKSAFSTHQQNDRNKGSNPNDISHSSHSSSSSGSAITTQQELQFLKKTTSKVDQKKIRRKQVFRKDEFSFNETLLPFSNHYFDLLLPSNYSIRIDAIKNQNQTALEIAKLAEICVKKKVIESILILTRSKYQKQLQDVKLLMNQKQNNQFFYQYNQKRKDFIETNKYLINLERAKIMLQTPSDILRGIHKREDVQIAIKKKNLGQDHLPFEELKQIIADRLPDAPKGPVFKVTINQELFRSSFHRYVDSLRRLITEIEIKGIFKGKKKKENLSVTKKSEQDEEDHEQTSAQINIERLQFILKNFEKNFKL